MIGLEEIVLNTENKQAVWADLERDGLVEVAEDETDGETLARLRR